jgi:hypothetical protein
VQNTPLKGVRFHDAAIPRLVLPFFFPYLSIATRWGRFSNAEVIRNERDEANRDLTNEFWAVFEEDSFSVAQIADNKALI